MPTIKKQALDLIDELMNYDTGSQRADNLFDDLKQLIEDNLLVSKDVFND